MLRSTFIAALPLILFDAPPRMVQAFPQQMTWLPLQEGLGNGARARNHF